jgi:DNA-binding transcriptional ArsR family regulator
MNEQEALAALSALAQPTRLSVFRLLVRTGRDGLAAGVIAETVGARPNTLSTHLQALLSAGLVTRERSGRSIIYSADYSEISRLLQFLMEDCCAGDREVYRPLKDAIDTAFGDEMRPA